MPATMMWCPHHIPSSTSLRRIARPSQHQGPIPQKWGSSRVSPDNIYVVYILDTGVKPPLSWYDKIHGRRTTAVNRH